MDKLLFIKVATIDSPLKGIRESLFLTNAEYRCFLLIFADLYVNISLQFMTDSLINNEIYFSLVY